MQNPLQNTEQNLSNSKTEKTELAVFSPTYYSGRQSYSSGDFPYDLVRRALFQTSFPYADRRNSYRALTTDFNLIAARPENRWAVALSEAQTRRLLSRPWRIGDHRMANEKFHFCMYLRQRFPGLINPGHMRRPQSAAVSGYNFNPHHEAWSNASPSADLYNPDSQVAPGGVFLCLPFDVNPDAFKPPYSDGKGSNIPHNIRETHFADWFQPPDRASTGNAFFAWCYKQKSLRRRSPTLGMLCKYLQHILQHNTDDFRPIQRVFWRYSRDLPTVGTVAHKLSTLRDSSPWSGV